MFALPIHPALLPISLADAHAVLLMCAVGITAFTAAFIVSLFVGAGRDDLL